MTWTRVGLTLACFALAGLLMPAPGYDWHPGAAASKPMEPKRLRGLAPSWDAPVEAGDAATQGPCEKKPTAKCRT